MNRQEMADRLLREMEAAYDKEESLIVREYAHWVGGYHTRRTGRTHVIRDTADYAASVLILGREEVYDRAFQALERICGLQDVRPGSRTFGLWPYYLEENLEQMLAPDYNWSDFIGKDLIGVCLLCGDRLPEGLRTKLHTAIRNAMECSIRRNVGEDYTNMSLMGCMTITAAGELLEDGRLKAMGRDRLERLCAYTRYNGAFSEYNSSAYILVAMQEIMRMLAFFRDRDIRQMAEELNGYAWKMLASHYNVTLGQLTPPQARAYRDVDNGSLAWAIWQGTGGRYGQVPDEGMLQKGAVSLESLCFPPVCPQELFPLFAEKERFLAHTYYRCNTLRREEADLTIIREVDSPDLTAYSWQRGEISMGAFAMCDCWAQRRNVMVVWNREQPRFFRLRCRMGDHDFCSGFTWAVQAENRILGILGLVTDRGSFHYILDADKNGCYETDHLSFRFELGGDCGDLRITQQGKDFIIRDKKPDGMVCLRLRVEKWMFDGRQAPAWVSEDGKMVVLAGYEGPAKRLDTTALGDTWGVFSLEVWEEKDVPGLAGSTAGAIEERGRQETDSREPEGWNRDIHVEALPGGRVRAAWNALALEAFRYPVPYRRAIGLDGPDRKRMEGYMEAILGRMQHMEVDGAVEENCPISIISMDAWEWPQGVALFAMYQYYKVQGDREVLEYLEHWFAGQIEKGLPEQNINTTCPMLTLACLYEETGNDAYLPLLGQWLYGVMDRLPRTGEGGLQHVVSGNENKGQLWDDTLYMAVLFLAHMGRILGEERYIQESIRQFLVHIKYLSDRKSGLFYHGWTFEEGHHFAGALWARGNSWYTAGLVDYLECLDSAAHTGVGEFLLGTLRRQVDALAACQDESGLWHTILDDPDSYLETSASCAFAYGILKAVRKGYLPGRYAPMGEKAVRGVLEQIREDGTVEGVSYGTPVFATIQAYKEVPVCPMPYGQSMALMMLVEACREV